MIWNRAFDVLFILLALAFASGQFDAAIIEAGNRAVEHWREPEGFIGGCLIPDGQDQLDETRDCV